MKMLKVMTVAGVVVGGAFVSQCNRNKNVSKLNESSVVALLSSDGVWKQVASDPYQILPTTQVSLWSFSSTKILGVSNPSPDVLAGRAASTIIDNQNIIKRFDKLVHPNGICLAGRWVIDQESIYTGFFKKGTNAPFIGRASSAFSETTRENYRAFGLAGKIFMEPTGSKNPKDYATANFFTIDDLAGTKASSFGDVALSNEPALTAANAFDQGTAFGLVAASTVVAFKAADSNPGIRQLYQISELGMKFPATAITPKWMHIKRISKLKSARPDFRHELRVDQTPEKSNFEGNLEFQISVSGTSQENMLPIGKIIIDRSVTSDTCDHRLHFNHPKFRDDLNIR
jgi:hypothetical protein